jgi:hypothetical protein
LTIRPRIVGDQHISPRESGGSPFVVGVLDARKGFVHVLDDFSLDVLLSTLDTVRDFVGYLEKKETVIRSGGLVEASGEEDLLALYLRNTDALGNPAACVPF